MTCCSNLFAFLFFYIWNEGSMAMFYLAAAVSDFYIPASEMPEHKIQSSNGPLQVSEQIPKNWP